MANVFIVTSYRIYIMLASVLLIWRFLFQPELKSSCPLLSGLFKDHGRYTLIFIPLCLMWITQKVYVEHWTDVRITTSQDVPGPKTAWKCYIRMTSQTPGSKLFDCKYNQIIKVFIYKTVLICIRYTIFFEVISTLILYLIMLIRDYIDWDNTIKTKNLNTNFSFDD